MDKDKKEKDEVVKVTIDIPKGVAKELKDIAKEYNCTEGEVLLSIFYRGLTSSEHK